MCRTDTGVERKHLHLGIKKVAHTNIRNYVQSQVKLAVRLDFEKL